jgi:hypothetical protein
MVFRQQPIIKGFMPELFSWRMSSVALPIAALTVAGSGAAQAQCPQDWRSGHGLPGVDGAVLAMTTWDPDGAGPQPELLIVGGRFSVAGRVVASNIASWDGSNWSPLGDGVGGGANVHVAALAVADGELVAGGVFTHAGAQPASNIARWNGTEWQALGQGISGGKFSGVSAVLEYQGDLIAGGAFTDAGGEAVNNIARWDGAAWHALGAGVTASQSAAVRALVEHEGDLIVGGYFTMAGVQATQSAARWDGSAWHAMPVPWPFSPDTRHLIVHDGVLLAGVRESVATCIGSGCDSEIGALYQWNGDGGEWLRMANWPKENPNPEALGVYQGQLLIAFTAVDCGPFNSCSYSGQVMIYQAEGANWPPFAGAWPTNAFAVYRDELIMASSNGEVVAWNGAQHRPLGMLGMRLAGLGAHDGAVVAGYETNSSLQHQQGVAWWTGQRWQPLAGAFDGPVNALMTWQGDLIAGGDFAGIDGVIMRNNARRDSSGAWHSLAGGLDQCGFGGCHGYVRDLVEYQGDLIAGGHFFSSDATTLRAVARWDGTQWHAMTTAITDGFVHALAVFNGELFAAGNFSSVGGVTVNNIARWNRTQWVALPGGGVTLNQSFATVRDLMVWDGRLIVTGLFDTAGGVPAGNIAAWNGTNWSALGAGLSGASNQSNLGGASLTTTPEGDLVVGGLFDTAGGEPAANLARYDGMNWHEIDGGVNGETFHVLAHANHLYASGAFSVAGNQASPAWALGGSACPAGDVNLDGVVDIDDIIGVILAWGPCPPAFAPCLADVNASGAVDVDDLIAVILGWNA